MKPAVTDPPEVAAQLWTGFGGDVGFDVGANCGQSTTDMLARFAAVYAFEPAQECAPWLNQITEPRFTWLPIAVSDLDDTVDLIALPDKIDTGQLVSADAQGMEYDPTGPDATARRVRCRTIDDLITRGELPTPDFLKIDVEGHEHKVLTGAARTLARHHPALLVEFHSRDLHRACTDLLASHGYTCTTVRHPHYYPGTDLWWTHGWLRALR